MRRRYIRALRRLRARGPAMFAAALGVSIVRHHGTAYRLAVAVVGSTALLLGCSRGTAPPAPSPPRVSVITLQAQSVPITTELPGRVTAYRTADVRPQVNGIIQRRLFVEGGEVKAG